MAPTDSTAVAAGDPAPGASTGEGAALAGAGLAAAVVAAWVLLAGVTGKTYHLAPPIAAAAPGVLLYLEGGVDRRVRALLLATAIGAYLGRQRR